MAVHERSIVVNAPVDKVYGMWSDWESFPKYMSAVEDVKVTGPNRSHWRARIGGIEEEWDAETTSQEPQRAISWRSVSGVKNRGDIHFDPVSNGTKITVHVEYDPPASILGDAAEAVYVGRRFEQSLEEDLNSFKETIEHNQ